MPTLVTVRRSFVVPALLDIADPDFAHWYGLGVFWAMFGDEQSNGPYRDTYIIDTIRHGITHGWYDRLASSWFPMVGFKLGMLHGGQLVRPSATLVVLTDPEFTKGYYVGRDYYVVEAPLAGRHLTDRLLNEAINSWALEYPIWHEPDETLRYCLGCRIGELSGALLAQPAAVAQR